MSSSVAEACVAGGGAPSIRLGQSLPQWKRELLERRRTRAVAIAPHREADMSPAEPSAAPAPPALPPDDEELRYGPGIVQRLKSRYLDLARKQAIAENRRRPSLRRAASLDILEETPAPRKLPPAQANRSARPITRAVPLIPRRDLRPDIKRARSVDALSRLDSLISRDGESSRETSDSEGGLSFVVRSPPPPPTIPPPPPPPAFATRTRKPRRASPLLSDAERPPHDLVKSTRRLFETAPKRTLPAPSGRVAAAVRGLTRPPLPARPQLRLHNPASPTPPCSPASPTPYETPFSPQFHTSTPEPRNSKPALSTPLVCNEFDSNKPTEIREHPSTDESDNSSAAIPSVRPVSRLALENISRAGQTLHFSFEDEERKAHLPVSASNPVVISRAQAQGLVTGRQVGVIRPLPPPPKTPSTPPPEMKSVIVTVVDKIDDFDIDNSPKEENGLPPILESSKRTHALDKDKCNGSVILDEVKCNSDAFVNNCVISKDMESAKVSPAPAPLTNGIGVKVVANKPRWNHSAQQNTMVFNFSNRKDVPDYIENDGMIIKANKKDRLKAGDPGVIILSSPSLSPASDGDSSGDSDGDDWGGSWRPSSPPEPCHVRFTNDNVLINGRSSLAATNNKKYMHLKIQFDDSLTRTFEYPSEASLLDDLMDSPAQSPTSLSNPLGNSPIVNSSLSSYTPSKVRLQPEAFQLGVTRASPLTNGNSEKTNGDATTNGNGHDRSPPINHVDEDHYLKPCQDGDSLNWSQETNQGAGDLLF